MEYQIAKIIHLISLISWMAGLFYLPRLFVYHCEDAKTLETQKMFQKMEDRLFKIIMMPAHILTYISGFYLAICGDFFTQPWFHIKLLFVFLLTFYHYLLFFYQRKLISKIDAYSGRYFRILNEIPTLLLIIIITVVVIRPF